MSSFVFAITNTLAAIGLGTISGRFITGAVAGFATQLVLKPSISYTKDGRMRSFALTDKNNNNKEATYVPWWMLTLLPGLLLAVFL